MNNPDEGAGKKALIRRGPFATPPLSVDHWRRIKIFSRQRGRIVRHIRPDGRLWQRHVLDGHEVGQQEKVLYQSDGQLSRGQNLVRFKLAN